MKMIIVQIKVMSFLRDKLTNENGGITLEMIGWGAAVIGVIIAVNKIFPGLVTTFMSGVFTKLSDGLGI